MTVTFSVSPDTVSIILRPETGSDDPGELIAAALRMAAAGLAAAPISNLVEQNAARRHAETLRTWAGLLDVARRDLAEQSADRARVQAKQERATARARAAGQEPLG